MASEFKQFLLRGNVVDLAVGVVIGVAFGAVVAAFVEGLLMPLIGAVVGVPDFSAWQFTLNGSVVALGVFVNAVLAFVLVAAAVFFVVVRPVNALVSRSRTAPPADPTTKKCPECLSDVPLAARRCAHCTVVFAA
jgi:large conductance mechanosensitive channel